MRTGLLILECAARHDALGRLARELAPRPLLVARLEPGTAGVVTDYDGPSETIRIGFPPRSSHAYFRVLAPRPGAETCASVALARMTFGRGIRDVLCPEADLSVVIAHALLTHDVRCWLSPEPCAPADAVRFARGAPPFDARAVVHALARAREADA